MSGEELDFWTPTIQAFAPLQLSSPELTPKLLKRPPFRFIHDILMGINARFAAYDHIFPPDQLNAANIDSKEKKIEFLTTLLNYVSQLLSRKIDVNVKKIVSGNEPEKTNVFLQFVALAVGYAQQDKAKKAQEAAPVLEATMKTTRTTTTTEAETKPPGNEGTKEVEYPKKEGLPPRSSLTKHKVSISCDNVGKKERIMQESTAFYTKVNNFGAFHLGEASAQTIKEVGQSIVKMYTELKESKADTKPTHLPEEALSTAIKRQIEAVQQLAVLQEENDTVVDNLEILLT